MAESFLNGKVTLHRGDCLWVLPLIEENSIDSIVTDPPYGLQFMGREWDTLWRNETVADQAYVERTNGQLTSRARKLPDYSVSMGLCLSGPDARNAASVNQIGHDDLPLFAEVAP